MKTALKETLNTVAGVNVEVTLFSAQGSTRCTLSFEGRNDKAAQSLKDFFKGKDLEIDFDEECDETYIYMTL